VESCHPARSGLLVKPQMCILTGLKVTLEPIYGEPITLKRQLELGKIHFINFFLDFIITTLIHVPLLLNCLRLCGIIFSDNLLLLKLFQDFIGWI
jgi:hypothetical protein